LSEGSPITIPEGSVPLKAEVVSDSDGEEVLELWLAIPEVNVVDTSTSQSVGKTIYTNTVIHNEQPRDDDFDSFSRDIENRVQQNLSGDDWDD
jgi:hypothetical protein